MTDLSITSNLTPRHKIQDAINKGHQILKLDGSEAATYAVFEDEANKWSAHNVTLCQLFDEGASIRKSLNSIIDLSNQNLSLEVASEQLREQIYLQIDALSSIKKQFARSWPSKAVTLMDNIVRSRIGRTLLDVLYETATLTFYIVAIAYLKRVLVYFLGEHAMLLGRIPVEYIIDTLHLVVIGRFFIDIIRDIVKRFRKEPAEAVSKHEIAIKS